jgi:hypothetical protein
LALVRKSQWHCGETFEKHFAFKLAARVEGCCMSNLSLVGIDMVTQSLRQVFLSR